MPPVVATPTPLVGPGFLWIAPLGTAEPVPTVAGGKFTDAIPAAWLPLGATTEGTTFGYSSTLEAVNVAEFFDPIAYYTTERSGSVAFTLANWNLTNLNRAMNGGVGALAATGTAGAELTTLQPPDPGTEVRAMLLWQSDDDTARLLVRKAIQGGEMSSQFQKAPNMATIPCTFNMEIPTSTSKPFQLWAAGTKRGA